MAFSLEQEIFAGICVFFALCIFTVCGMEIRSYVRKKTIISGKQLTVRLIGGVLMTILLIKLLYGIYWVEYPRRVDVDYFLRYWAGCVALAYFCLMIATVDLWFTMRLRRASKKTHQRIAEKLQAIANCYEKPTAPDRDTKPLAEPSPEGNG